MKIDKKSYQIAAAIYGNHFESFIHSNTWYKIPFDTYISLTSLHSSKQQTVHSLARKSVPPSGHQNKARPRLVLVPPEY